MEKKEQGQAIQTDDLCRSRCYRDRSPEDLLTLTGEGGLRINSGLSIVAAGMQNFLPLWEKTKPFGQRIRKEQIGRWRLRFLFPLSEHRFTHRRQRRLTKGAGFAIPTPSTNSLKTASVLHACYLENG